MGSTVIFFKRALVGSRPTTELLANYTDMSVSTVMASMYTKIQFKKLGNHCSNAMGRVENVDKKFNDRYFYNVAFVDKQLFDSDCIKRLMSVHKLVKWNVLFSDVVKSKKQVLKKHTDSQANMTELSTNCIHNKPANISKGKIVNHYGNAG